MAGCNSFTIQSSCLFTLPASAISVWPEAHGAGIAQDRREYELLFDLRQVAQACLREGIVRPGTVLPGGRDPFRGACPISLSSFESQAEQSEHIAQLVAQAVLSLPRCRMAPDEITEDQIA